MALSIPDETRPPPPLRGIRVLDLSRVLAGPWASQTLADLGAEIIKVERPGSGDDTRAWGPPFLATETGGRGESAYYLAANRGKRSITVNLARPEGQDIVRRLAAHSDILLENFKTGDLARRGLGFEDLSRLNPRLIYASITGFGATGPYADRAGYDFLMQGMGGLMSVTGEPDGPPMKAGVAVNDLFTGMYAATALLAALVERGVSNQGQHIEIALLDVQVATMANQLASYLVSGVQPPRLGNAHPSIVPYQAFKTADRHVILAVGNDEQFRRFAGVVGSGHLAADPRFATNPARVANRDILVPALAAIMLTRSAADWIAALQAAGVPCGPINDFADIANDPHVQARDLLKTLPHAQAGTIRAAASPMRFSRSAIDDSRPPPLLGADTQAVLRELLGASRDDIEDWTRAGVL